MNKLGLVLIPIIIIGGIFLFKGTSRGSTDKNNDIPTVIVEEQDVKDIIYVNGKIATESIRNVKPQSEDIVDQILVDVGDSVKAGDVVAEMNKDALSDQLKAKKIQLEIETAKLNQMAKKSDITLINTAKSLEQAMTISKKKMEDDKALLESGIVSNHQYEESVNAYEKDKLVYENAVYEMNSSSYKSELFIQKKTVESLENEIESVERKIEEASIKAPIDGVVTKIIGTEGESIKTSLLVISDFDKNVIKANISEADFNKVSIGQKAIITANSVKGKAFEGKVTFIEPGSETIEGKKQAYVGIKITLDQAAPELRTNFSVNVQLITAEKSKVKTISVEAVNQRANNEEYVLLRLADGSVKEVPVETGITNDVVVEIISDEIEIGDEIEIMQSDSVGDSEVQNGIGMY